MDVLAAPTDAVADVLAYIDRKIANARAVAAAKVGFDDEAKVAIRQLEILRDDLKAELHVGCSGEPAEFQGFNQ
ncbi:hypothetical protein ACWPMX_07890 [Tsuneonella sp. HG094]